MKSVTLIALLLITSTSIAQITDDELGRLEEFDAWVHQAFHPQVLETVQGIRALGHLLDERSQPYSIAHASSELEIREFVFEGLAIDAVVEKAAPYRVWVTTIKISSPLWPLENGLAVGQSTAELGRLSVQPEAGSLSFCGVNNCLVAEERNGSISSLKLDIYLD